MIYGTDCMRKYGYPDDNGKTPNINELNQFQKNNMVLWDVPALINLAIPAIPNKIYCNKDLVGPLQRALELVIKRGLQEEIKTWDGCYNLRAIRAYEKQYEKLKKDGLLMESLKYLSIHSWAIAIDINAAWNGLGKVGNMSKELIKCFEEAGFEWGGRWKRLDPMHFQLKEIPTLAT